MLCDLLYNRIHVGVWNRMYKKSLIGNSRFRLDSLTGEGMQFNTQVVPKASKVGMGLRRVYTYNVDNETSATKKPNVRKQAYGAVATMDMIREGLKPRSKRLDDAVEYQYFTTALYALTHLIRAKAVSENRDFYKKLVRYTRSTALKTLSMETSTTQKIKYPTGGCKPDINGQSRHLLALRSRQKTESVIVTNNKSHSRIFKNALFLYALTFSNYLIGLLLLPYLSRVLSVEKFGVIGFATSFCLVFQMVVEYGFQLSTTATISVHRDDKAKMSRTISTMTCTKLLLACGASAVFLACAMFVDMLRGHFVIILLFFVDSIAKALLPDAYFRGIERMKDITIRAVSAKSGILVATLLFVKGDDTLIIYPVSMIVFDTIALLWAFSLLKRDGLKATGTTMREMLEALKDSFWFFISRISVSVNGSLGSIFLGMRYSPESVEMGLYSGATKLSSAGEQMIPPLGDALYPSMVNKKDYRLFYRIVLRGGILWFLSCGLVEVLATRCAC